MKSAFGHMRGFFRRQKNNGNKEQDVELRLPALVTARNAVTVPKRSIPRG